MDETKDDTASAAEAAPATPSVSKSVLSAEALAAMIDKFRFDEARDAIREALFTRRCPKAVDMVAREPAHAVVIYEDVRRAFMSPTTHVLGCRALRRAYGRAVLLLARVYQDGFAYFNTFPTTGPSMFRRYAMVHTKVAAWVDAYGAASTPSLDEVRGDVKKWAGALCASGGAALPNPIYVRFMSQASLLGVALRQHIAYNSEAITADAIRPTLDNIKLVESQCDGMARFLAFLDTCPDWSTVFSLDAVPRFDASAGDA